MREAKADSAYWPLLIRHFRQPLKGPVLDDFGISHQPQLANLPLMLVPNRNCNLPWRLVAAGKQTRPLTSVCQIICTVGLVCGRFYAMDQSMPCGPGLSPLKPF